MLSSSGEGSPLLTEGERANTLDQLGTTLRGQSNFMILMMQGIGGMMSSNTARQMQEARRHGSLTAARSHWRTLACANSAER